MKALFGVLILTFLVTGCSHKNAFTLFNMSKEQELSASSLQSSKIKLNESVNGVVSAIYLNEIYPDRFTQNEYFFIYLYTKDKNEMFDPNSLDDIQMSVKLNSNMPLKVEKLQNINQFSDLISVHSIWNKYYLVAFEEQGKTLSLVLESGQSVSAALVYQKDEQ